jgi:hypothetical protein
MKLLFTILFSLSIVSFGQTKLIAFKSHSGNSAYFSSDGIDNIGLPSLSIDTIRLLNDSTIIEIRSRGNGWDKAIDTVVNHPVCRVPHLTVDTLRGMYYRKDIEFIGFDTVLTKKEIKRQKKWSKSQEKLKKKRAKLLEEYKEVDKRIVKTSEVFLLGSDGNNNTPNDGTIEKSNTVNLRYFGFGLMTVVIILFSILYRSNRNKVII